MLTNTAKEKCPVYDSNCKNSYWFKRMKSYLKIFCNTLRPDKNSAHSCSSWWSVCRRHLCSYFGHMVINGHILQCNVWCLMFEMCCFQTTYWLTSGDCGSTRLQRFILSGVADKKTIKQPLSAFYICQEMRYTFFKDILKKFRTLLNA